MTDCISASLSVSVNQNVDVTLNEEGGSDAFGALLQASFESKALSKEEYGTIWEDNPNRLSARCEGIGSLISSNDVDMAIKKSYAIFSTLFDDALASQGIKKDPAFEVYLDSDDKLYIDSDHKDKERIEKILNENEEIRDAFSGMSGNSSMATSMLRLTDFCHIVSDGPHSVQEQYNSIYNSDAPEDVFSIKVSDNWYRPKIMSQGKYTDLDVFEQIENDDMSDHTVKRSLEFSMLPLENRSNEF